MKKEKSERALSALFSQLSALLRAGSTPEQALLLLEEGGESAWSALRAALEREGSLARAAAACPDIPETAAALIDVGESAGRLEQCLDGLGAYYERRAALRERLQNAMVYPVTLLLMMCAVLAVLVWAVMPVFSGVYESLTGTLLSSAYGYVAAAGVVARIALLLSALVCVLALLSALAVQRKGADWLWRFGALPPLGRALRTLEGGRLADALSVMLRSGMGAENALERCRPLFADSGIRQELERVRTAVNGGERLEQALRREKLYSPLESALLFSAGAGGNLDGALEQAGQTAAREGAEALCRLIDGVEPAMTLFLTATVGMSLLSAMLPLIGLLSSIG